MLLSYIRELTLEITRKCPLMQYFVPCIYYSLTSWHLVYPETKFFLLRCLKRRIAPITTMPLIYLLFFGFFLSEAPFLSLFGPRGVSDHCSHVNCGSDWCVVLKHNQFPSNWEPQCSGWFDKETERGWAGDSTARFLSALWLKTGWVFLYSRTTHQCPEAVRVK